MIQLKSRWNLERKIRRDVKKLLENRVKLKISIPPSLETKVLYISSEMTFNQLMKQLRILYDKEGFPRTDVNIRSFVHLKYVDDTDIIPVKSDVAIQSLCTMYRDRCLIELRCTLEFELLDPDTPNNVMDFGDLFEPISDGERPSLELKDIFDLNVDSGNLEPPMKPTGESPRASIEVPRVSPLSPQSLGNSPLTPYSPTPYNSPMTPEYIPSSELGKSQFKILQPIGSGSFGNVYKIRMNRTGKILAMKQIPLPKNKRDIDSIEQEIAFTKKLTHKCIIHYLGTARDHKYIYLFMVLPLSLTYSKEYASEGSLQTILSKEKTFKEPLIRAYVTQILEGLVFLHMHHIIHRGM